ncbi:perlucin-like protein [Mya arenaria]|uniref:perlucin-like protein n=1 Tax=Mya arenaria TaxID=6604 RepID=UPI0022E02F0C|nr:perlucin-like protein [Mya arenaria]
MDFVICFVVVTFLALTVDGQTTPHVLTSCPNGWIAYEGSCYLFNNKDKMSFVAAEEFCKQNGGHVVHIDGEAENNFIKDQARQYPKTSLKLWWIGIKDMTDGEWRYTSDDSLVTFFDWDPSQPNKGSNAECAVLWADKDYKWGDHPCVHVGSYSVYAVCEAKYMKSYLLQ